MADTVEGIVTKSDSNQYGHFLKLRDRKDFINESKKSTDWPHLTEGDRVRFPVWQSDSGKMYVNGQDIEVLPPQEAQPDDGGIQYDERRPGSFAYRDKSILFQVCLKEAREYVSTIETAQANVERVGAVAAEWYERAVLLLSKNGQDEEA